MTSIATLDVAELVAEVARLKAELLTAQLYIEKLKENQRKALLEKYGARGESLSSLQLQLLELEPGVHRGEVEGERNQPAPAAAKPGTKSKSRPHPGRQELPAHLPRREEIVAAPREQRTCKSCGGDTAVIGYDESTRLAEIPKQYYVRVIKREKRACPCCRHSGVRTAPAPPSIVEKGLLDDSAIIGVLVRKYADHVPLYRQSEILSRDSGVEISVATLDGIVMQVGQMLIPVVEHMRREILGSGYVQADETPVPVQQGPGGGKGKHHQAYLWQYSAPGGEVVFDFRMGRGREGPARVLKDFTGILQTDGYTAYDQCGGGGVRRAACWAHARRGFVEALKLHPDDRDSEAVLRLISELFAVDAEAREQKLDHEQRRLLREERARPALAQLFTLLQDLQTRALPASALGKAVAYTLTLWERLTLFLEHPRLELSNNLAENSMRPVAVGRKNWIHVGHPAAGPRVAAIISVIESCRRLNIPVRQYLADTLPGMQRRSHRQLAELTPKAWAATHA